MDELILLSRFIEVVQSGSFAAAAERLAVSPSVMSKQIARLEAALGTRLINRTTRSNFLTEAGALYYEHCQRIVAAVQQSREDLAQLRRVPAGLLRVTAPAGFGSRLLAARLPRFVEAYPEVQLEIQLADRAVNLAVERFDIAIRITEQPPEYLVAREITRVRHLLVAAPAYLARRGRPATPADLVAHVCLAHPGANSLLSTWDFEIDGRQLTVAPASSIRINDGLALRELAVQGVGLALLPAYLIADDVRSGTLVTVLEAYAARARASLFALYFPNRAADLKQKVFVEFLLREFRDCGT